MADQESESTRFYLRIKEVFGADEPRRPKKKRTEREVQPGGMPFAAGRDPHGLGDLMDALTTDLGWTAPLAQSDLIGSWTAIAGEETAKHSSPVSISDGVLTVACESTAWATQLRMMRVEIMNHISVEFPEAGIDSVRFQGPDAPSWKKGPRSIPGRGPRDTYG